MAIDVTEKAAVLSLQARLEQLEAAITEGHAILDRMQSREGAPAEASEGALNCVDRCQEAMGALNARLERVASLVGAL